MAFTRYIRTVLAAGLWLGALLTPAFKPADKGNVTVVISNLRNDNGAVLIAVYNDPGRFPKDASRFAFARARAPIRGKKVSFTFTDMPYGKYAIAILHDENTNLKMDTNLFGMPKE